MKKGIGENQNLNGALRVVLYVMSQISENRAKELKDDIDSLIQRYSENKEVNEVLNNISGLGQLHRK